ncbi:MAG: GIY-YIG nuclease family protein [Hymenobacteraceae bacterium]|nr:GIY-YIG nuclease family protein [Hymenobacteraceae bacterium]
MGKQHRYFVYVMTNAYNTTLYVGVTNDLARRVFEHCSSEGTFTAHYRLHKLVYYEEYQWIQEAIAREKQLKAGSREKKLQLIREHNPEWLNLADGWYSVQ